ncbi:DNA-binding MarR family transcriptional regulator [Streptomyces sp. SAI-135]|uniref:MarR family winged helix-turn-helix transcriptional regulator n=1 Tax=unclassified Streptomyces TaxID=2593676 RepID=UPI002475DC54|nr:MULTISPECIES: MarR family transcriptional regulator [unclassified Streptomyces]MDH6523343.1 DNA-binding MarR family transcriptional regulator [Streptomyces sp. SAI-090]MDH6554967.1 DNA-binding MarR family transcriptional regulator [Streptomyces sp. SAI-041]MDH6574233.1 DNA-binding MarR family transcriptional regulator [Streptomyces sp. SAI-117]MDH6613044.1 DNA-binding MarR family transcriptional regulator [Streptomyces sp. SAI-135]
MDTTTDQPDYLTDAVTRLERAVANIGALRLKPWRMTLSGYAALKILERQPHVSLAQLSRRCFVKSQTMTRIVAELERREWVERSPHPESERAISLALTPAGRASLAEMAAEVDKIESTLGAELEPGQFPELVATLRRCAVAVEAEIKDARRAARRS